MEKINIYQIESTNYCNGKCSFCPHNKMIRKKGFILEETFLQALAIMKNDYVALHHFGEPLLHPLLFSLIIQAKKANKLVEFSTNGKISFTLFIKKVMDAEPYIIRIAYDQTPDDFIKKALTFNKSTIVLLHSVTKNLLPLSKPFNNFAGAVEGESEVGGECYFKKYKYVCVLWDGKVVPCCQDYDGQEVMGNIWEIDKLNFRKTYKLCNTCKGMQFAELGLWKKSC